MISKKDLNDMIPTLQENISLAKKLIEKNPGDESAKMILDSQQKTLNDYLNRLKNIENRS